MPATAPVFPPPLLDGERLSRDEFMRRWEAMPDLKHAGLLDGIVHMPSPVSFRHNFVQPRIIMWLRQYADATPGCQVGSEGTWLMGTDAVPQPDVTLRLVTGGSSRTEKIYLAGAPELVIEIAWSSSASDLGMKSDLYRRHGVREYLVILAQENDVLWREAVKGRYRRSGPTRRAYSARRSFPDSVSIPPPCGARIGFGSARAWMRAWQQPSTLISYAA